MVVVIGTFPLEEDAGKPVSKGVCRLAFEIAVIPKNIFSAGADCVKVIVFAKIGAGAIALNSIMLLPATIVFALSVHVIPLPPEMVTEPRSFWSYTVANKRSFAAEVDRDTVPVEVEDDDMPVDESIRIALLAILTELPEAQAVDFREAESVTLYV